MLHVIAVCTNCPRQYYVDDKKPGDRFHCLCGGVIRVKDATRGLESTVVRCSSCGAPRAKGARSCLSCESDFTIHEKDMHTVCPECTARISDKAKFCHHCGKQIAAEFASSSATKLCCPNCENNVLSTREIDDNITFLECQSCAGLWINQESFAVLLKKNRDDEFAASLNEVFPKIYVLDQETDSKSSPTKFYKSCPNCRHGMNRRNFAQMSGIIIDVCRDHGIWFDENELTQLLRWIREGGLSKVESKLEFDEKIADFKKQSKKTWESAHSKNDPVTQSYTQSATNQNTLMDLGESFLDVIGDFFGYVIK